MRFTNGTEKRFFVVVMRRRKILAYARMNYYVVINWGFGSSLFTNKTLRRFFNIPRFSVLAIGKRFIFFFYFFFLLVFVVNFPKTNTLVDVMKR